MASEFYDMKSFLDGRSSLNEIELELLGDLKNKSVCHLQCHFGQDTISMARLGAKVTGIDFSDEAIKQAKCLTKQLNLPAQFICSDIYSIDIEQKFDIVFASYGVLGWHPDVSRWMKVAKSLLNDQGRLVLVEFHPFVWMFDRKMQNIEFSYFNLAPIVEQVSSSYTDGSDDKVATEIGWNHSLSDIFMAALDNNLSITRFNEYPVSPYDCFDNMVKVSGGYQFKDLVDKVPLVYALEATSV
ncbi:MAG: class I SAM-dependent methyltransferase [Gammaproteobacteria bacterium]|nr:class I SAM-dependent methyltransferase [Gammaproteobacteria bacterium]